MTFILPLAAGCEDCGKKSLTFYQAQADSWLTYYYLSNAPLKMLFQKFKSNSFDYYFRILLNKPVDIVWEFHNVVSGKWI